MLSVSELVARSNGPQSGGDDHDPWEAFAFTPKTSGDYYLVILHLSGTAPAWIQLQDFYGTAGLERFTPNGSIGNPAESANPGMVAVGAAPWWNPTELEDFSSRGPTTDGRRKPDVVGADHGDSVSYGASGFPGTSQASPHVAGLAALALEVFPHYTPAELAQYLKDNADETSRVTTPNPNNNWGHGFAKLPALSVPGKPTISEVLVGNTSLTPVWAAPSSNGGAPITAYDVRYRETGTTPWTVKENAWTSGSRQYTITGLTNSTGYDVQVRAVNAAGDGAWSDTATGTPATSTNPTVSIAAQYPAIIEGSIAIFTITASAAPSADLPVKLMITGIAGEQTVTIAANATTKAFAITTGGAVDGPNAVLTATLRSGTGYTVDVTKRQASVVVVDNDRVPPAPSGLTTVPSSGQVVLGWSAVPPSQVGTSPLTHYTVEYFTAGTNPVTQNTTGNTTTLTVTTLTNGTTYYFRVRAVSAAGNGAWSSLVAATLPSAPAAPTILGVIPGPSATALTVAWALPADDGTSPITAYDVQHRQNGTSTWTVVDNAWTSGSRQYTITGLTTSTQYDVQVRAVNAVGNGAWSATTNGTPATSTGPTIDIAAQSATITEGQNAVFTVTASAAPSTALPVTIAVTSPGDQRTITGLPTTRTVTIAANATTATLTIPTGGAGAGTNADVMAVVLAGAGYIVDTGTTVPNFQASVAVTDDDRLPGSITNLTAASGSRRVALRWVAPTDSGTSPIRYYTVSYSETGTSSASDVQDTDDGDTTTLTVTGLTNGTQYLFRVSAVSAAGSSTTSNITAVPAVSSGSSGGTSAPSSAGPSSAPAPAPQPTAAPQFSASNSAATVSEQEDAPGQTSLVFQHHDDPAASFAVQIGWISRDGQSVIALGFVRDESLGQTYAIVRRESDGQIVRLWVAPHSPLVYAVPWAEVNSRYTVPLAVLALVPMDDQYPQPNQLVRRFDGGDDRILAYDAELAQWRHVPDLATFQALGFYWCNVTAADGAFFARITLGPPYPASSEPARADYPSCGT